MSKTIYQLWRLPIQTPNYPMDYSQKIEALREKRKVIDADIARLINEECERNIQNASMKRTGHPIGRLFHVGDEVEFDARTDAGFSGAYHSVKSNGIITRVTKDFGESLVYVIEYNVKVGAGTVTRYASCIPSEMKLLD